MKVKSSAKWKSIPLAHSFFTAGMDQVSKRNFIVDIKYNLLQAVCGGIEELTDYTLVLKGSKSGKVWSLPYLLIITCLKLIFIENYQNNKFIHSSPSLYFDLN